MEEKREVFVLGYRDVDFVNEETGEKVQGTHVYYIDHNVKYPNGYEPARVFLRENYIDVRNNGTGIYDIHLSLELKGNRPNLRVSGFTFKEKADLLHG